MSLISWSNALSVNIKQIDEQHKKMIDIINDLHDAMSQGKGSAALAKIFDEMVDYTHTHFTAEEQLMAKYGYPGFVMQKSEHDALTKKVLDWQRQYKEGKIVLSMDVMGFLRDWWTGHIMGSDQKYAPFLKGKGLD